MLWTLHIESHWGQRDQKGPWQPWPQHRAKIWATKCMAIWCNLLTRSLQRNKPTNSIQTAHCSMTWQGVGSWVGFCYGKMAPTSSTRPILAIWWAFQIFSVAVKNLQNKLWFSVNKNGITFGSSRFRYQIFTEEWKESSTFDQQHRQHRRHIGFSKAASCLRKGRTRIIQRQEQPLLRVFEAMDAERESKRLRRDSESVEVEANASNASKVDGITGFKKGQRDFTPQSEPGTAICADFTSKEKEYTNGVVAPTLGIAWQVFCPNCLPMQRMLLISSSFSVFLCLSKSECSYV